jgi:hypothetical protein
MNLLIGIRTELLKSKRSASLYVALAAAAFGPLMSSLDIFLDEGISPDDEKIILSKMFIDKFQMTSFVMFPLFVILICTLLPQIEYRNQAWKQVLTTPQTKGSIFTSKFINIHILILVFLLANKAFMLVAAVILHLAKPELQVLNQSVDGSAVLAGLANSYVALLALCALQFWMGLRFQNFIAPIAIGIVLWFAGTILVMQLQSAAGLYFPYSFHAYGTFPQFKEQLNTVRWTSVGYAAAFLLLGFIDFRRRSFR